MVQPSWRDLRSRWLRCRRVGLLVAGDAIQGFAGSSVVCRPIPVRSRLLEYARLLVTSGLDDAHPSRALLCLGGTSVLQTSLLGCL